nr:hypothetical protein [Metabacillus litoralis]
MADERERLQMYQPMMFIQLEELSESEVFEIFISSTPFVNVAVICFFSILYGRTIFLVTSLVS